jgi:hypothetical protein
MKPFPDSQPVNHNPYNTDDLRITAMQEVIPPSELYEEFPINAAAPPPPWRRGVKSTIS